MSLNCGHSWSIVHPSDYIWAWRATVVSYCRRNRKTRRKACPSATLSTADRTWPDRGLRGDRPANNRLAVTRQWARAILLLRVVTRDFWTLSKTLAADHYHFICLLFHSSEQHPVYSTPDMSIIMCHLRDEIYENNNSLYEVMGISAGVPTSLF
jgi:hypothetical protein